MGIVRKLPLVLVCLFTVAVVPVMAHGTPSTTVEKGPLDGTICNFDCLPPWLELPPGTGEALDLAGHYLMKNHTVEDGHGGWHVESMITRHGTATGPLSGVVYRFADTLNFQSQWVGGYPSGPDPTCPQPQGGQSMVVLISQNKDAPSLRCNYSWHVTYDANCNITVDIDHGGCQCM